MKVTGEDCREPDTLRALWALWAIAAPPVRQTCGLDPPPLRHPQVVGPPPMDNHGPYGLLRDKCVQWIFLLWKNLRSWSLGQWWAQKAYPIEGTHTKVLELPWMISSKAPTTHVHIGLQSTQDHFSSCCLIYRAHSGARRSWLVPGEPLWSPGPKTPPLALLRGSPRALSRKPSPLRSDGPALTACVG